MKLKEKLAKRYALEHGYEDAGGHIITSADGGFMAGFEKCRELAYRTVEEYGTGYGALMDSDKMLELGEEEVE